MGEHLLDVQGVDGSNPSFSTNFFCECGGTGRRAWLRAMWPYGCGGSSPPIRTTLCVAQEINDKHNSSYGVAENLKVYNFSVFYLNLS